MSKTFDNERLDTIPIDSVLTALGVEHNGRDFICPYEHSSKKVRLKLYESTNSCHCHNCKTITGTPITAVKLIRNWSYIEAATWLHESFNIPYLEGELEGKAKPLPKIKKKEIEYLAFDPFKECNSVNIKNYLSKFAAMTKDQKLKMVYTYLYRFSMRTEQKAKFAFYKKERGIPSNNTYIAMVGFLSQEDIVELLAQLKKYFPTSDLLEFGVLKEKDDSAVFAFDYINKGGILVVPSFDLYTDMVTGFMLRPTHPAEWMKKQGLKELQLSKSNIVRPLPFGITCKALRENDTFYFTEGHPDLASIPGNINGDLERAGVASPGTYGFKEEMMSLFRGKKIILVYDQDFSGQKAEHGYHELTYESIETKKLEFLDTKEGRKNLKEKISRFKETKYTVKFHMGMKQKLILAGVKDIEALIWNKNWGGDINDLRIQGNLSLVFPEKDKK